jgi:diguanylate cyclase (GGDEF)-like protein
VSLLYACTDLVGIVVAVRCLLAGRAATHGIWLLAAVYSLWYVTDLTYAVQELTGVYVSGGLLDLGWYLPNALLALTCWTGFSGTGRPRRRGGRHAPRMAIAALIGLAGPLGICVTAALDIPTSPIALAAGTVFPMALALTRMNRLLHTVEHQATHDSLTGLLNRAAFTEQAEDELSRGPGRTVLLIDLNGFKQVNDTNGHAAGDLVLARTALRLIRIAGPDGLVGRIGGDEFAVLLATGATTVDVPGIELALRSPVTRGERAGAPADELLQVSASVGAARGGEPGGPSSVEQLLAAADAAMYTRKRTRDPAGRLTAPLPRRG